MSKNLLVGLLALSTSLCAQNVIFQENWDGDGPGATEWKMVDVDGLSPVYSFITDAWVIRDRGESHGGPTGNYAAVSTSWYEPVGTSNDWMISPRIGIVGANPHLIWEAKAQDPSARDGYKVMLAPNGGDRIEDFTVTLMTVEAEEHSSGESPWKRRFVDLSAYAGQIVRIAFVNNSTDKYFLLIDNILVLDDFTAPLPPECVNHLSPASGATIPPGEQVRVEWEPSAEGGAPLYYRVFLGNSPSDLRNLGMVQGTNVLINNLRFDTTYYWKIIGVNETGETPSVCPPSTFVVGPNPALPYCGPMRFNFMEPISRVEFADMVNESSADEEFPFHEFFTDKVANVKPGATYTLKVQGNTLGNYTNRIVAFIDWNQDGVFSGANETIVVPTPLENSTGKDGKEVSVDIIVPSNAVLGETRMRIKKTYGAQPLTLPCISDDPSKLSGGQAEDYTIRVGTLALDEVKQTRTRMYPNPVGDVLNLEFQETPKSVKVYDMNGKLVYEQWKLSENSQLDLSHLLSGVYMVIVETEGYKETLKMIKK